MVNGDRRKQAEQQLNASQRQLGEQQQIAKDQQRFAQELQQTVGEQQRAAIEQNKLTSNPPMRSDVFDGASEMDTFPKDSVAIIRLREQSALC